jgi:asparagine synthase (glutamine-hydrolysing)
MPGIVGLITKMPRKQAEPLLLRMVETLRHESFYETGTWIDESLGVYVGWAARKNSFSDGMPVQNERGDVTLAFSGEEYPEPGIVSGLKQRGHVLEAAAASYLVHLYEENPAFPACLNGRFHGLLMDRARGTATLFNDRYGMHRIYFHESKEAFYFTAEAKAILAVRPELRRANLRSLGEFVTCGCVLENRTLFNDIYVLPPASSWIFQDRSIVKKGAYFWPREWEEQPPLESEAHYQELRAVFSQNLSRYLNGREPVAMSLTGGLDTRMIMAWHKFPPASLPCYTFGGMYRDCRDVLVARQVARACRQSHEVIPVGGEFLSRFPYYAERAVYLTDACVEVNRSPDLYVNEKAREIAPVRIGGNYGSEVLRGGRAFKPIEPNPELFRIEFFPYLRAANETYARVIGGHPVSFAAFRQAPWHHYGLLALEETQLAVRSPYLDNDLVQKVFRAPSSVLTNSNLSLRLIADGDSSLRRIQTDRGLGGDSASLPTTAYHSLQEFTFKAEYAYDYGMPQWVARIDHFFSPLHLERLFLGRHKFYHFRVWYRDALSKYVREMLLDSRTLSRPYLEPRGLEAAVRGHLKGDRNYTVEITKVLTLELLHRLFLDTN